MGHLIKINPGSILNCTMKYSIFNVQLPEVNHSYTSKFGCLHGDYTGDSCSCIEYISHCLIKKYPECLQCAIS